MSIEEKLKNPYQIQLADDLDFSAGIDEKLIEKLLTDYKFFMETFLVIKTKDKRLVPFILNPIQQDLYSRIHGKPYYYGIILKARQMGCSTFILGYFFTDCILNPNTNCVCVAHDQESVNKLFDIIHLFYNNLPDVLKPKRKYSNRKELYFCDPTDPKRSLESRFFVGSAQGKHFGRSMTIQNLHLSEYAFYPDIDKFLPGIIDAVPLKNSRIIIESTANGLNHFYEEFKAAMEHQGSIYEPIFYPWWMFPEYELPVSEEERQNWQDMDEEERELREKYKLSLEKLKFRRFRISLYGGDKSIFKKEYPSNWQEAFLAQTQYRFGFTPDVLKKQEKFIKPAINIQNYLTVKYPVLKLWEDVEDKSGYVVCVDVAEGSETGHLSAIEIFKLTDKLTLRQVGEFSAHVDLITFSKIIYDVAAYFNSAVVLVEKNNQGYTIINNLLLYNYPYIFKENDKEGIFMTKQLKIKAIDTLIYLLNSEKIEIQSEQLLHEIKIYATVDTNTKKAYDDNIGHFDKFSALLLLSATYPGVLNWITANPVKTEEWDYFEFPEPKKILTIPEVNRLLQRKMLI
jgi:hypothetical protein